MEQVIYEELMKNVNWVLILIIGAFVEFVKAFLPDEYEPKVLPIISIAFGAGLAVLLLQTGIRQAVQIGVINGALASGLYGLIMKIIGKIGQSFTGNGNGAGTPPVIPSSTQNTLPKILLIAVCMSMLSLTSYSMPVKLSETQSIDIFPDLHACLLGNIVDNETYPGIISNMLRYKALDLSLGGIKKDDMFQWIGSLSICLNRVKFNDIQFLWDKILDTNVGIWVSRDKDTWIYGWELSIIKATF